MDYYIVRIYRRDEFDDEDLTGLVETVGAEGTKVFKNPEELWRILCGQDFSLVKAPERPLKKE